MAVQHSYGKIVTDGLVLCLDAADRNSYVSGSTIWRDVAGSNNGTLTNGPTFNTGSGGSIVFDGINDYVDVPVGLLTSSTSLTVEFIAKFTDNVYTMTGGMAFYGACYPYFYGGNSGNFEGYAATYNRPSSISPYTGLGSFGVLFQNGSQYSTSVSNISINVPYIITSIFSPTIVALYVNGNFAASSPAGNSPNFDGNGLRIGSGNKSFNGFFNGNIYSYKQYNRVLSAAEILQNYNAQKSRFGL